MSDVSEPTKKADSHTPDPPSSRPQAPKGPRILSCVLCQQRKIRCDRKFPCANCIKQRLQCVPAVQGPRRRRRFAERELLDRIRKYEDLLRQNHIKFDALHKESTQGSKSSPEEAYESDDEQLRARMEELSTPSKSEGPHEAKSIWQAMSQEAQGSNNDTDAPIARGIEVVVKDALDQLADDDHILFGSRKTAVDLSTFHPEPVDIFRLWQIYLDNVNPLFKVTHTPSLQGRIIEAASNVSNIGHAFEALMFSMYSVATLSLAEADCLTMFGLSKEDLMTKYRFGCQQALMNARYLRSADRDCLTALHLYVLSIRNGTDPRTLSSVLAVAIRIAQNMGIHKESSLARCSVFEAEMRRRLWWSLMFFDTRMAEKADQKEVSLSPAWDCKVPLNINDSDLREDMKEPPVSKSTSTEALFIVVLYKVADFIRHSSFHLDFTNPALQRIAKELPDAGSLTAFEKSIKQEYFEICDPDNPIDFMTIWITQAYIAKNHVLAHYSGVFRSKEEPSDSRSDTAMSLAFRMLECDMEFMSSPLIKNFHWHLQTYFPFPAHMLVISDLQQRPLSRMAQRAWDLMSGSYEVRLPIAGSSLNPLLKMFDGSILSAWETFEVASGGAALLKTPMIVSCIRERRQATQAAQVSNGGGDMNLDFSNVLESMMMSPNDNSFMFGIGQDAIGNMDPMAYLSTSEPAPLVSRGNQFHWPPDGWAVE